MGMFGKVALIMTYRRVELELVSRLSCETLALLILHTSSSCLDSGSVSLGGSRAGELVRCLNEPSLIC